MEISRKEYKDFLNDDLESEFWVSARQEDRLYQYISKNFTSSGSEFHFVTEVCVDGGIQPCTVVKVAEYVGAVFLSVTSSVQFANRSIYEI